MSLPIYQVDAFADRPFTGNPAAVCLLERTMPDAWMQALAAEMNLAETAFLLRQGDDWSLRWFTPSVEVDICGHATLASAHVLISEGLAPAGSPITFQTKSGALTCSPATEGEIRMDFPADPVRTIVVPEHLDRILGARPLAVSKGREYLLVEIGSEEKLRLMKPHMGGILSLGVPLLIITCEGRNGSPFDFLSRCFAPAVGIPEDPVTGSAHCTLACYWAKRLGKNDFRAYQASRRGGALGVALRGERVLLTGRAVTVFKGTLDPFAAAV